MSSRSMNVSVLVSLIDKMTGPMRQLTGTLDRFADAGRKIGIIGAAVAGLSFVQPIQAAAAFDSTLRDIAITAGKTGGQVEQLINAQAVSYQKLALQVGQKSADIAAAAQVLVSAGMAQPLIDQLMPTIGKVATAANAAISDTAKTAFALSDALKIPADQMELAMAKLVTAGKLGRFEFKNMAAEFPELTAQVAKLGVTGMEAVDFLGAALQTAMKGTNNPATAANNLKNFLSKVAAPDAIKNFKEELGVDIVGVMTNATAKGINPVEAVLEKLTSKLAVPQKEIDKILKDAKAKGMSDKDAETALRGRIQQLLQGTKIGKLYADMQVQDFLIPFLLNKAGYKADKAQIAGSDTSVIDNDFESRRRGMQAALNDLSEIGTQASRRIGVSFGQWLPGVMGAVKGLTGVIDSIDARFPNLIGNVLMFGGAALALGAALAILTPVFTALGAVIGLVLSPVGLLAAAITALGYGIYQLWQNWDTAWSSIKTATSSAVQAIAATFLTITVALAEMIGAVETRLGELVTWFTALPGRITGSLGSLAGELTQAGAAAIQGLWDGMKAKFDEFIAWVAAIPGRITGSLGSLAGELTAAGAAAIQGLWDGMKAKFDDLIAWVANIPKAIVNALGNLIDLSNVSIKMPSLPSIFGGNPPGGTPAPATPSSPGAVGGTGGFAPRDVRASVDTKVGGRIVVSAVGGAQIKEVASDNPAVPITPDRGAMLGRA